MIKTYKCESCNKTYETDFNAPNGFWCTKCDKKMIEIINAKPTSIEIKNKHITLEPIAKTVLIPEKKEEKIFKTPIKKFKKGKQLCTHVGCPNDKLPDSLYCSEHVKKDDEIKIMKLKDKKDIEQIHKELDNLFK